MQNDLLDFIITSSLYSCKEIRYPEVEHLIQIYDDKNRFELYCPECKEKKVFMYDSGLHNVKDSYLKNKISSPGSLTGMSYQETSVLDGIDHIYLRFKCSLNEFHKIEYFFSVKGDTIIKVGQYLLPLILIFHRLQSTVLFLASSITMNLKDQLDCIHMVLGSVHLCI